jgi:hypothetical protein
MTTADITSTTTLVTALGTQITALAGLTGAPLAAQQAVVLNAGNAARAACMRLVDALGIQRAANARTALSAILDPGAILLDKPLEQYATAYQAVALQRGFFADYSGQPDKGLASYELLPARWTALSALLTAETGLITG